MERIKIKILNQLKDNYSYILESKKSPYVSIIDPAESKSHLDYLKSNSNKTRRRKNNSSTNLRWINDWFCSWSTAIMEY